MKIRIDNNKKLTHILGHIQIKQEQIDEFLHDKMYINTFYFVNQKSVILFNQLIIYLFADL